MKKKYLAFTVSLALVGSVVMPVHANNLVGHDDLRDVEATLPYDETLPKLEQYRYQKEELSAFVHFGPNTFNEIEWGEHYGNQHPSQIFTLSEDFDAETLVKTIKDAGFKRIIVTAKHHDGFCIWPSAYTDYDIASTNYKNGKGDILAEISAVATKYNIDMGLYLSPWDIHDPSYGYYDANRRPVANDRSRDALDYNDYYTNQLTEILSNPKYGNNGRFVEIWLDGAKGSGANSQDYDFDRFVSTIQRYEGKAAGFDSDVAMFGAGKYLTVRWIGNENGFAPDPNWSKARKVGDSIRDGWSSSTNFSPGFKDGNIWSTPEADARITSGWFWGTRKNTPKSLKDLSEMYLRSVGHGAVLLLNIPPNNRGKLDDAIKNRVVEFGEMIKNSFKHNVLKDDDVTIKATSVFENARKYSPETLRDDDDDTVWSSQGDTGQIVAEFASPKKIDAVTIEEAIQYGQKIDGYKVEVFTDQWTTVSQGESIGSKRIVRFKPTRVSKIRITVNGMDQKSPILSSVGAYKLDSAMELPQPYPDGMDFIDITNGNGNENGFNGHQGFNPETGSSFLGETSQWARKGGRVNLNFEGSYFELYGTKDPAHGQMKVTIDDQEPIVVDTNASARKTGQLLFKSPNLSLGSHRVQIEAVGIIGIDGAAVLNNNGKGLFEFEENSYTAQEDSLLEYKVIRRGGTVPSSIQVSPNPGTAIQEDFNTEDIENLEFGASDTEKIGILHTRRNTRRTGDKALTLELSSQDPTIALSHPIANVTIKDFEEVAYKKLLSYVSEVKDYTQAQISNGFEEYRSALTAAQKVLNTESKPEDYEKAYKALKSAVDALEFRNTPFSETDRFKLPTTPSNKQLLEAEFGILHNSGTNEAYPLQISSATWASRQQFVNALNANDEVHYPITITKPGRYTVEAVYRSGNPQNKIAFRDSQNLITPQSIVMGANDGARETHTMTFTLEANQAGNTDFILYGEQTGMAQLDTLKFKLNGYRVNFDNDVAKGIIESESDNEVALNDDYSFKIKAKENHYIQEVRVNDVKLENIPLDNAEITLPNVQSDQNVLIIYGDEESDEDLKQTIESLKNKIKLDDYTKASRDEVKALVESIEHDLQTYKLTLNKKEELKQRLEEASQKFVKHYQITTEVHGKGKISPSMKVIEGENAQIEIIADQGYLLDRLLVDGKEIEKNTYYLFKNVNKAHTITAYFVKESKPTPEKPEKPENIAPTNENSVIKNFVFEKRIDNNEKEKPNLNDISYTIQGNKELYHGYTLRVSLIEDLNKAEAKLATLKINDAIYDIQNTYNVELFDKNGKLVQPLENTSFKIILPLSKDVLKEAKKGQIYVIHYHGNTLKSIPYKLVNDKLEITLSEFSKIMIVKKSDQNIKVQSMKKNVEKNVKTNDSQPVLITIVLSIISLIGFMVLKLKNKQD